MTKRWPKLEALIIKLREGILLTEQERNVLAILLQSEIDKEKSKI